MWVLLVIILLSLKRNGKIGDLLKIKLNLESIGIAKKVRLKK